MGVGWGWFFFSPSLTLVKRVWGQRPRFWTSSTSPVWRHSLTFPMVIPAARVEKGTNNTEPSFSFVNTRESFSRTEHRSPRATWPNRNHLTGAYKHVISVFVESKHGCAALTLLRGGHLFVHVDVIRLVGYWYLSWSHELPPIPFPKKKKGKKKGKILTFSVFVLSILSYQHFVHHVER